MLYFHTVFAVWQATLIDPLHAASRHSIFQGAEFIAKLGHPPLAPWKPFSLLTP
jgi:hypothetical protein